MISCVLCVNAKKIKRGEGKRKILIWNLKMKEIFYKEVGTLSKEDSDVISTFWLWLHLHFTNFPPVQMHFQFLNLSRLMEKKNSHLYVVSSKIHFCFLCRVFLGKDFCQEANLNMKLFQIFLRKHFQNQKS